MVAKSQGRLAAGAKYNVYAAPEYWQSDLWKIFFKGKSRDKSETSGEPSYGRLAALGDSTNPMDRKFIARTPRYVNIFIIQNPRPHAVGVYQTPSTAYKEKTQFSLGCTAQVVGHFSSSTCSY